MFILQTVIKH